MNGSIKRVLYVLLLFDLLLFASVGLPFPRSITYSVCAAAVGLALWQAILLTSVSWKTLRIESGVKKPHYVQTVLQICLYAYWGLYWEEVRSYAPLLIVQLLFAYLFDMLLAWSRGRVWHWGFGQFPIVLSINLFIWFRPEHFYWQFVLIALAYLGKEFVTWTYAGKKRHIFNPSAFCLASVSAILMATNTSDVTRAFDIVESFMLAPSFYEVVFLLGLVVQFLFGTTLVTLSATFALYFMFVASRTIVGVPLFDVAIGPSVFLGVTLLVTDPSTSPKTTIGRLLFGTAYGAGIFLLCIVLRFGGLPTVFDKILMVPVVNLMVPLLDRIGTALHRRIEMENPPSILRYDRFGWIALYVGLFLFVLPGFKALTLVFESPLPVAVGQRSEELDKMLLSRKWVQLIYPAVYEPFGFSTEFAHYPTVMELLHMEPEQVMDKFVEQLDPSQIPDLPNESGQPRDPTL